MKYMKILALCLVWKKTPSYKWDYEKAYFNTTELFLWLLRDFTLLKKLLLTAVTFFFLHVCAKIQFNTHYAIKGTRWIYYFLGTSDLCRISVEGIAVHFYRQLHKNSTAHLFLVWGFWHKGCLWSWKMDNTMEMFLWRGQRWYVYLDGGSQYYHGKHCQVF